MLSIKFEADDRFDEYLRVRISLNASDKTTVQATFQGVERTCGPKVFIAPNISVSIIRGGCAASALLAACGKRSETTSELRTASKWFSDQTIVSNLGPQRTVWSFSDEQGNLGGLSPETIEVEILTHHYAPFIKLLLRGIPTVAMPYYPVIVPFQNSEVHEFPCLIWGGQVRRLKHMVPGTKIG